MRKLLWIGDAACESGFARCTHRTLEALRGSWDIHVLGLNYRGDPHRYPYPIYPACLIGYNTGDYFGLERIGEMLQRIGPDLVVVQNDPWNLPAYMSRLRSVPTVAALAVDGRNCRGRELNGLAAAVFWTQFGLEEARLGGYTGPACVIPLGVDLDTYRPYDRREMRKHFGLPARTLDGFLVGNVNRNQPRKRLDLTIAYFAEWVRGRGIDDAYLMLHVAPTGDAGYDCAQLAAYYGVANRMILSEPNPWSGGESEEGLARLYSCFDVLVSTTQGEGWGLTAMEAMACGVPCILPDWAAFGEWARPAAALVECSTIAVTPNRVNVIGGVADSDDFVDALDRMYRNADTCALAERCGSALVAQPEYRWSAIGERWRQYLDEVMTGQVAKAAPAKA